MVWRRVEIVCAQAQTQFNYLLNGAGYGYGCCCSKHLRRCWRGAGGGAAEVLAKVLVSNSSLRSSVLYTRSEEP